MPDPITAAVAGGASIIGGIVSSNAAKSAANTQADAADRAAQLQYEMYQQQREDLAPWRAAGQQGLNTLQSMLQAGPGDFKASEGYQWTLGQGQQGIQNAMSAMGRNRSGSHLKAATSYAEGLASTEYDNFLKRWYQSLTPYQSMAQIGMTTGEQLGQSGMQAAANAGNATMAGGNAIAQGVANQSNALTGTIGNLANQYTYYNQLKNVQQQVPYGAYGNAMNYGASQVPYYSPWEMTYGE